MHCLMSLTLATDSGFPPQCLNQFHYATKHNKKSVFNFYLKHINLLKLDQSYIVITFEKINETVFNITEVLISLLVN